MVKQSICIVFFFLLSFCSAFAEIATPYRLEAESIQYDGQNIELKGNVLVEQQFGLMQCDHATIIFSQKSGAKAKMWPSKILLIGNVFLKLRDESEVVADQGDVNCDTLEGAFFMLDPTKNVIYKRFVKEDERKIVIKASSKSMKVRLKSTAKEGSSQYELSDLRGDDTVRIEYEEIKEAKK